MNFDEACAEWVGRRFPGAKPILGTVNFEVGWAAWVSGPTYSNIDVTWEELVARRMGRVAGVWRYSTPKPKQVNHTLIATGDFWGDGLKDFDLMQLIREIVAISSEDSTTTNPSGPSTDTLEGQSLRLTGKVQWPWAGSGADRTDHGEARSVSRKPKRTRVVGRVGDAKSRRDSAGADCASEARPSRRNYPADSYSRTGLTSCDWVHR
jgi:hypothetical protein